MVASSVPEGVKPYVMVKNVDSVQVGNLVNGFVMPGIAANWTTKWSIAPIIVSENYVLIIVKGNSNVRQV